MWPEQIDTPFPESLAERGASRHVANHDRRFRFFKREEVESNPVLAHAYENSDNPGDSARKLRADIAFARNSVRIPLVHPVVLAASRAIAKNMIRLPQTFASDGHQESRPPEPESRRVLRGPSAQPPWAEP